MTRFLSIIIVILLVVGGGSFLWYQFKSTPAHIEIDPVVEARLVQLRQFKTIHLDTTILKDSTFRSLVAPPSVPGLDSRTPGSGTSSPFSAGRSNPFLPF